MRTFLLPTTLLAAAAAAQPAPLRRAGAHFELHCHFDSAAAAERALAIVETTWPIARALYGGVTDEPERRLEVHLYRNAADYAAAEAKLTGGRFRRNLAFAHWDTQTAHVAVQPELSDAVFARIGLTTQTLRLLAHEAAHLVRFRAMPNYRSHPDWFADGNASWIETEVLRALHLLDSPELDPGFSTNVVLVQSLLARDAMPATAEVLLDRTGELRFYEQYAVRWLLFRFLMTEPRSASLRQTIAAMRRFGGGGEFAERSVAVLQRQLGAAAFARLDADFRAYVTGLHPVWEQTARALEPNGEQWLQAAFDATDAEAWRTEPIGTTRYEITGRLLLLPDRDAQLSVLLGRTAHGFVAVSFGSNGEVAVSQRSEADQRRERLASAAARIAVDRPFSFTVSVAEGGALRLDVDGARVIDTVVEHPLDGAWGLGAQAGSSGIWHNVMLRSSDR